MVDFRDTYMPTQRVMTGRRTTQCLAGAGARQKSASRGRKPFKKTLGRAPAKLELICSQNRNRKTLDKEFPPKVFRFSAHFCDDVSSPQA
ncbi:hypothetical protein AV530_005974 [Patagioenas fasciata monilis]|uniref:Uncharacterized protein n=1 Tax=Patagioenas fasciata monilis TaxID=372326 RepID=A0A1V4JNH6_PATFA|nr:hypothetical protein AV530_005974 [Patagioenas fasciata monilis]